MLFSVFSAQPPRQSKHFIATDYRMERDFVHGNNEEFDAMKVTMSAPGKVTLFGEHAVVYGKPAIVSAIDRRLFVSMEERSDTHIKVSAPGLHIPGMVCTFKEGSKEFLVETDYDRTAEALGYVRKAIETASEHAGRRQGVNVEVTSEMPVGAGLGTSAAIAVCTVAAYCRLMGCEPTPEEIARMGHATELKVQGSASPMDTTIITYGGTIYLKPTKPKPHVEKMEIGGELPIVIGYIEREAGTGDLLRKVRALRDACPKTIDSVIGAIGELVEEAKASLVKGDLTSIGMLMNINHGLLEALGVSTKGLSDMAYSTRRAGAIGSKMTGAGGGGCVIALCPDKKREVDVAIRVAGGEPFQAALSGTGVRLESIN